MAAADEQARAPMLRRGFLLEFVTLGWNVVGIVVLAIAAVAARSVALAGFGLDSLIEIGASVVVVWELSGAGEERQRLGLRLIGYAFSALAVYLLIQSSVVLATGYRPRPSLAGIVWTAVTAAVMFGLAAGKARTGRALDNPVLRTEGRVTTIDGILAVAVLAGLALNAGAGWWWRIPRPATSWCTTPPARSGRSSSRPALRHEGTVRARARVTGGDVCTDQFVRPTSCTRMKRRCRSMPGSPTSHECTITFSAERTTSSPIAKRQSGFWPTTRRWCR